MEVDVAIVGGGPAGCSSAITLLAGGYSVAIVASPCQKEKPTETATPALKQLLLSIKAQEALSACEPCFGICSDWGRTSPALQPSIINPFGHAWFIHRTRFDNCLQKITRKAGGIWLAASAHKANFDADGVALLTTGETVHARWLIVASGSPAWAAQITQQTLLNIDSLIAFWTRLPVTLTERLLFVESADYGWWYACPDDGNGIIVCLVTDAQSARSLGSAQIAVWNNLFKATNLFQRFGGKSTGASICALPTGLAILPRKHGPRWTAVGDAAMKLDPLGSSGTTTAIDSGGRAGQAVAEALQGNTTGLERYARWSIGLVEEFARQREQHYAVERLRRVGGFWSRRMHDVTENRVHEN